MVHGAVQLLNTHALQKRFMIGRHLDQELDSEQKPRGQYHMAFSSTSTNVYHEASPVTRNFNKVQVAGFHHTPPSACEARAPADGLTNG